MTPAMPALRASALALCTGMLLATASGCADPQGEFDKFSERWDRINGDAAAQPDVEEVDAGPCPAAEPSDVAPYYYVALSAMLANKKPIMFLGTLTWDGTSLGMTFQPLSADDHKTPAGDPITGGPFTVNEDGSFDADMGAIAVTGAANPISGSDIETLAVLHGEAGRFCKPLDFICGTVTGTISKPDYLNGASLDGSFFTMTRMPDATTFPEGKVKIDCEGNLALY